MATTNGLSWENSKENAAPLRRGRSIEHLEQPKMTSREKDETISAFEQRITEESASEHADFLQPWLDYIKWHQNFFPSEVHEQFLLLERCFRAFQTDRRIFHDSRYIRVCCLYADKTQEPKETFQELYRIGIGKDSATFWNAWAYIAEKSGDFRMADSIFRRAIQDRAEPVEFLLRRQKHFQKRMAKHFLESINDPSESVGEEEHHRSQFGSISAAPGASRASRPGATASSTFIDRSSHSSASSFVGGLVNASRGSFGVYSDDIGGSENFFETGSSSVREREPELHRWKENKGPRERWNDRTVGPSLPAKPTAFAIHVDEECAAENARKDEERARKEKEQREARRGLLSKSAAEESRKDAKKAKPVWKKALLKDDAGIERCFEEARYAAQYFRLIDSSTNFNLMVKSDNSEDSSMSLCDSQNESVLYEETAHLAIPDTHDSDCAPVESLSAVKKDDVIQKLHEDTRPGTILPNASWNSDVSGSVQMPTPTINTQFAMNQVSMMFSSPMVGNDIDESMVAPLMQGNDAGIQLFDKDENDPNRPRYLDSRSLPEAEPQVLQSLEQEDEKAQRVLSCQPEGRRRIGPIRQDNPMAGLREHNIPTNPGFSVYEENDSTGADSVIRPKTQELSKQGALPSFTIFQDEDSNEGPARQSHFRPKMEHCEPESDDSVNSEDLKMFGGAAEPGDPTFTGNVLDRLTVEGISGTGRGTQRCRSFHVETDQSHSSSQTVAPTLPCFDDLSLIEEEHTSEFHLMSKRR